MTDEPPQDAPANPASRETIARIAQIATADYSGIVRRRLQRLGFQIAVGLFVLIAGLAATAAGGILLAERYGPVAALLIIAGAALLVALLILAVGQYKDREARRAEALLEQNRQLAVMGALPFLSEKPRRSMTLLVALGAIFALRKVLLRRS